MPYFKMLYHSQISETEILPTRNEEISKMSQIANKMNRKPAQASAPNVFQLLHTVRIQGREQT